MASDKECDINNVTKDENTTETTTQKPEKSGWLLKRTKISKQWEKKWFSLKERTIFYGDSPDVSDGCDAFLKCAKCLFYR